MWGSSDIEYALQSGSYPRWHRNKFPHALIKSILAPPAYPSKDQNHTKAASLLFQPTFRCIFDDLISVAHFLNNKPPCVRIEPFTYQEILISISYRLLHLCSPADLTHAFQTDLEELCHFSMLAMITTLFFQHGAFGHLVAYKTLTERLQSAIERASKTEFMYDPIFLWALFTGGISVFRNASNKAWFSLLIKAYLSRFRIDDWTDARIEIKKFPWIDIVHDCPGIELWRTLPQ